MIDSPRVCVQVQSVYVESQSTPDEERYVFAYTITIRNLGRTPVQLLGRYWLITNGNGRETEVQGEGVVGEQPHIAPGGEYQYTSGAVIETPMGTMQGHYEMVDVAGQLRSASPFPCSVSPFQHLFINPMSTYLIGDVHGCYDELIALLKQVDFSPEQDTLWLTGDLVARGPGSLEVLRFVKSLGDSVRMVLGNHDLHLLAVFAGISRNKPKDRLTPLLEAPDADDLINWLRRQPLLQVDEEKKLVMAHAGITPQWDLDDGEKLRARRRGGAGQRLLSALPRCHVRRYAEPLDAGTQRAGPPALYHQCLHPHAFLLPERTAGHVLQRDAGTRAGPAETVVRDSGTGDSASTASSLVTGHRWKAKARRKGFTGWIPAAAGAAN